ncbi:hypothetical protein CEXT_239321 [Caerostris extrusa]|uniref:Uncharacterized protein n=1 Tax=Caerostris extrusa TaxID=172846 RepID=A0AAV4QTH1_CAEEX|nr:hypothetical protein CEXT_239321 [Caerostris extrusa]
MSEREQEVEGEIGRVTRFLTLSALLICRPGEVNEGNGGLENVIGTELLAEAPSFLCLVMIYDCCEALISSFSL